MNKVFASKNMMRINGTKILEIDTVDFIEFRMDQMGWTQKDLIPFLGSKEPVSEVMNRKREYRFK